MVEETTQDNPKQKLWNALNSAGYYTKGFNDFDKQFSTPESISKLHGALNSAGYYTKTEKDFNTQFFVTDGGQSVKKSGDAYEPGFQKAERERQESPTQAPYKTAEQQHKEAPITQPKQPKSKGYAQSLSEGLTSGTLDLAAGIQNMPKLLNAYKDKGSDYVGKLVGKAFGLNDKEVLALNQVRRATPDPLSDLADIAEQSKESVNLSQISKDYSQATSEEDDAINDGRSLVGLAKDFEINKAGKKVTKYLGQAIPTVTGFVLAPEVMLTAGAAGDAANTYEELQSNPQYAGVDDGTKLMVATGHGAVNLLINKYAGDIGVGKEIGKILIGGKEVTREVAEQTIKKSFVDLTKKALSKASPIKTATYNYLGAIGEQFAKNLIDKNTVDPEKDLEEGVWEAGEGAIAVGGALMGLHAASSIKNPKLREEVKTLEANREAIVKDIEEAELPDTQKELLQNKVESINDRITSISKKDDVDAQHIDGELADKIYENNAKIEAQEAILNNKKLSDASKELASKEIEKLIQKSEKLNEEAVKFDTKHFDELAEPFKGVNDTKGIKDVISKLVDLGTIERICN